MATLTSAIAIGYVNRASGKTITATSANASYPASNLSNARLLGDGATWRSVTAALTSVRVVADLTTAQDIDVVALLGWNGQDAATCTVKTSESSGLSAHEYTSGSITPLDATTYPVLVSDTPVSGRNLVHFPGTTKNSRYAGFDTLNDSGNPDNYLKASVIWVGPVWQPTKTMDASSSTVEKEEELVGEPGMERALRVIRCTLRFLTEGEARQFVSVARARLRGGRLLVVPRPLSTSTFIDEAIYCTIAEPVRRLAVMVHDGVRWAVSLVFREVED